MRKHLSVLQLYIRATFLPFLALLAGMAAVETGLFLFYFFGHRSLGAEDIPGLELMLSGSKIILAAGVAGLLITALLSLMGCSLGSETVYTLNRLSISENAAWCWQAGYNTVCYLIFWAVQLLLVVGFSLIYCRYAPAEAVTHQTIFLAAYRNEFFNGLLPLSEPTGFVRNGLLCLALGTGTALFSYKNRRGKTAVSLFLLVIWAGVFFRRTPGSVMRDLGFILLVLGLILYTLLVCLPRKEEELL